MRRDPDHGPRRGRPFDPAVDVALRSATLSVLAQHGWRGTTVERIAQRSGVARTTIYRRYGSVHGVMIMLLDNVWVQDPAADTGSLRGDLVMTARATQTLWADPDRLNFLCAMTTARRENKDVAEAMNLRGRSQHAALRPIVERAQTRGELRTGLDPGLMMDLVRSVIVRRAMDSDLLAPPEFAEQVVNAVLLGFSS
jgi:AcrR family transcriptional regulator